MSYVLVLPLLVCSCGWHALYESGVAGRVSVADELAQIDVPVTAERSGQLLRQALQQRLRRTPSAGTADYSLELAYSVGPEGIAIASDTSITRIRFVATANFALRLTTGSAPTCVSGQVRVVDAADVESQQYFAADLAAEEVQRRLAAEAAARIVGRLAAAFAHASERFCAA